MAGGGEESRVKQIGQSGIWLEERAAIQSEWSREVSLRR